MNEPGVFIEEAVAVGMKAIEQGVAKLKPSREELYKMAEFAIKRSMRETELKMKEGIIKLPE